MKAGKVILSLSVWMLIGLFVLQGPGSIANASDVTTLLREINNELRQAERDMFGGKTEQAIASLEKIQEKINQVKQADPDNSQIVSHENRFQRLVRDLERRTGRDIGGGTLTAAGASTETALPPKPESKPLQPDDSPARPAVQEAAETVQLPHAARRPAQDVENELARIERAIERLSDPRSNPNQLLGDMESYLRSARNSLEIARDESARRGVTDHPQFDILEERIADAETKISEAHEQQKETQAMASEKAAEVEADVKALKDQYDRVQPVFSMASGGAIYYNDLVSVYKLIEAIESFEENDLDKVRQHMQIFGEKYGTTRDEIDARAASMGYQQVYYRASYAYTQFEEGIENIEKTRRAMAQDLVRRTKDMQELAAQGLHDFARLDQHRDIREWGQMAVRFDPENDSIREFNNGIDAWVQADIVAFNQKIDKAVFPGQAADAPADAAELVLVAKDFLQMENEKLAAQRGSEVSNVLAVSVIGPWRVFKTNLLGEPVQYNLPIATAVQTESEKAQNLVRVYYSTILTQEMRGVQMAPPFTGVTMGDSHYIRPAAIGM